MQIITPEQMRELDRRLTHDLGLDPALLMETAGRAIVAAIVARIGEGQDRFATVLCGTGNNGGDGFVAARVLARHGFRVEVYVAGDPGRMTPPTAQHHKAMKGAGVDARFFVQAPRQPDLQNVRRSLGRSAVIVDALVGTGPTEDLRDPVLTLVQQLDGRHRGLVVAADIPSGLCATDGRVLGAAVRAHLVVTMAAWKTGLCVGAGPDLYDEVVVADIGVPKRWLDALAPCGATLDAAFAAANLPQRSAHSHKGSHGHVFVVAGSPGKAGAALLCAGAAMRTGVGLCTVGTSGEVRGRLEACYPEAMVEAIRGGASEIKRIEKLLTKKSAVVVGPGLGTGAAEVDLVLRLLALSSVPVLLDADALGALASKPDMAAPAAGRLVLTPHPGEMATLLDTTIDVIEADRFGAALKAAQTWQAVVVLKGSRTLVVEPAGAWAVCPEANAALAKGGSGDVLAGVIGSLLAQGLSPFAAAQLGVALHSEAGVALRRVWGSRAGLASDLVALLGEAQQAIEEGAHGAGRESGERKGNLPRRGAPDSLSK